MSMENGREELRRTYTCDTHYVCALSFMLLRCYIMFALSYLLFYCTAQDLHVLQVGFAEEEECRSTLKPLSNNYTGSYYSTPPWTTPPWTTSAQIGTLPHILYPATKPTTLQKFTWNELILDTKMDPVHTTGLKNNHHDVGGTKVLHFRTTQQNTPYTTQHVTSYTESREYYTPGTDFTSELSVHFVDFVNYELLSTVCVYRLIDGTTFFVCTNSGTSNYAMCWTEFMVLLSRSFCDLCTNYLCVDWFPDFENILYYVNMNIDIYSRSTADLQSANFVLTDVPYLTYVYRKLQYFWELDYVTLDYMKCKTYTVFKTIFPLGDYIQFILVKFCEKYNLSKYFFDLVWVRTRGALGLSGFCCTEPFSRSTLWNLSTISNVLYSMLRDNFSKLAQFISCILPMIYIRRTLAFVTSSFPVRIVSRTLSRISSISAISCYDEFISHAINHPLFTHLYTAAVEVLSVIRVDYVRPCFCCLVWVAAVSSLILIVIAIKGGIAIHIHTHNYTHNHILSDINTNLSSGVNENCMTYGMTQSMAHGKYSRNYDILNSPSSMLSPSYLSENITVMTALKEFETPGISKSHTSDNSCTDDDDVASVKDGSGSVLHSDKLPVLSDSQLKLLSQSPVRSPSQKLDHTLRIRSINNNTLTSWASTESLSSQNDDSDADDGKKAKKEKVKWIHDDGCYHLDQQKKCEFDYMKNFIEDEESDTLLADLSKLILETCKPDNTERYRIRFSQSTDKAVSFDPLKTSSKKWSVGDFDIDTDCTLSTLILKYREKITKTVAAVFDVEIEFGCVIVNNLSDDKDSIPYELFSDDKNPNFSPTVAVLALGATRAMYLKPLTTNSISHKVSLYPGSLCVLGGLTESKYRHSIPRNYGEAGAQQMTLLFLEKKPEAVPTPIIQSPKVPHDEIVEAEVQEAEVHGAENKILDPNISPQSFSSPVGKLEDHKMVSLEDQKLIPFNDDKSTSPPNTKTFGISSPVGKKLTSNQSSAKAKLERNENVPSFELYVDQTLVNDEVDFEEDANILLAGTLDTLINTMDNITLDTELKRNKLSTSGSVEMKRSRLITALHMKMGELLKCNSGLDPIKLMKYESIDSLTKQELQTLSSTQNHIEESMKHVVDNLNNICIEVAALRDLSLKQEKASPKTKKHDTGEFSTHMRDCLTEIKTFSEQLASMKAEMKETQDIFADVKQVVKDTRADIQGWYNSAFFHEDSERIKDLHNLLMKVPQNHQEGKLHVSEKDVHEEKTMEENSIGKLKLAEVLKMKQKPNFCLITDSIMRHVTQDDLGDKYSFTKIDKTDSTGLTHNSLRKNLMNIQPHLIYVHLGINDIQDGIAVGRTVSNFGEFELFLSEHLPDTKLIVSLPLLNGKEFYYRSIVDLRIKLSTMFNNIEKEDGTANQRRFIQYNKNFFVDAGTPQAPQPRTQTVRLFSADKIHPSTRGKMVITGNMRDALYRITRSARKH